MTEEKEPTVEELAELIEKSLTTLAEMSSDYLKASDNKSAAVIMGMLMAMSSDIFGHILKLARLDVDQHPEWKLDQESAGLTAQVLHREFMERVEAKSA